MDLESTVTNLTESARIVLEKRYLQRNPNGQGIIETPEEMFRRVAKTMADDKQMEQGYFEMMSEGFALPSSPILMNAGVAKENIGEFPACFVLPVDDDMVSIYDAIKKSALIHKGGGGTGFSFSQLRPMGDSVGSRENAASGPVSFMSIFNQSTRTVKQGGKRRGANMGVLRVDHPDIIWWAIAKKDEGVFECFNISVAISNEFMRAVEMDLDIPLINPRNNEVFINPHNYGWGEEESYQEPPINCGKIGEPRIIRAKDLWDLMMQQSWSNGEPGFIFIDTINDYNPTPDQGRIQATNPCGEVPLLPNEVCNLLSINLSKFVKDKEFNWSYYIEIIRRSVCFLDSAIDKNPYQFEEIREMAQKNRKIGVGIMGLHHALIKMDLPYDSKEAFRFTEDIIGILSDIGLDESGKLAKTKGVFPSWEQSSFNGNGKKKIIKEVRNATITTIAPTGTISIIANCSSGIEPVWSYGYTHKMGDGTELKRIDSVLEATAKIEGWYSPELIDSIIKDGGSLQSLDLPERTKRIFKTANEIDPITHVKMQIAAQKNVHNAVSKTINMPFEATIEDVESAILFAFRNGCKGLTVYRDGSRTKQVLERIKICGDCKSEMIKTGNQCWTCSNPTCGNSSCRI